LLLHAWLGHLMPSPSPSSSSVKWGNYVSLTADHEDEVGGWVWNV
jgi:hypothetical protein